MRYTGEAFQLEGIWYTRGLELLREHVRHCRSVTEVAQRLGTSYERLSDILDGKYLPSLILARRIEFWNPSVPAVAWGAAPEPRGL
jgi:hypothetical protein